MVGGVALAGFLALTLLVAAGWLDRLDNAAMMALAGLRRPWLTDVMRAFSVAGAGWVEAPVALLVILGLRRRALVRKAKLYGGAVLSGWLFYALAKLVVHRARPRIVPHLMHDAGWYSYPSGHAALAPIVFGLAAVLWIGGIAPSRRVVRLGAVATLTGAIALSRVYLGLHYPSDVAGGLLLGIGWSFLWLPGRAYAGLAAATEEPLLER